MGIAKAALEAEIRCLAWDLGPAGVRVNGISGGPMRTLTARGVGNTNEMFTLIDQVAPLHRNVSQMEMGNQAASLLSDEAKNLTGNIPHPERGLHLIGL